MSVENIANRGNDLRIRCERDPFDMDVRVGSNNPIIQDETHQPGGILIKVIRGYISLGMVC